VLGVLVERRPPRHLLRRRIDRHWSDELADRGEEIARDVADGAVGRQRDAPRAAVAVLGDRLVPVQIQRDDERPGTVGRRERERLPATRSQAQRRVLELRLRRRGPRGQLPEHVGVRVQRRR
jgi:hypothetical protein